MQALLASEIKRWSGVIAAAKIDDSECRTSSFDRVGDRMNLRQLDRLVRRAEPGRCGEAAPVPNIARPAPSRRVRPPETDAHGLPLRRRGRGGARQSRPAGTAAGPCQAAP